MSTPSKAAITFATSVYAQMFGEVSSDPVDVNRMVVLAIAFDSLAKATREQVAEAYKECAKIANESVDEGVSMHEVVRRIRARGAS